MISRAVGGFASRLQASSIAPRQNVARPMRGGSSAVIPSSGASLKHVMLLVRDVEAATQFYGPGGIGLPVIVASRHWAELSFTHTTAPADFPVLALKLVDGYVASGADAARSLTRTVWQGVARNHRVLTIPDFQCA